MPEKADARPPTPAELAKEQNWIARQLAHPAPLYLLSDLVRLCGPNLKIRRLRRVLIRKGVLERSVGKGREHLVSYSRLMSLFPDLWWSIRAAWREREAATREADEDRDSAA